MLIDYIQAAMRHAEYELMENGRFFGHIPPCKGLWAEGKTLEECREDLEGALQDWIVIKLRFGDRMPIIDRVNINPSAKPMKYAEAH